MSTCPAISTTRPTGSRPRSATNTTTTRGAAATAHADRGESQPAHVLRDGHAGFPQEAHVPRRLCVARALGFHPRRPRRRRLLGAADLAQHVHQLLARAAARPGGEHRHRQRGDLRHVFQRHRLLLHEVQLRGLGGTTDFGSRAEHWTRWRRWSVLQRVLAVLLDQLGHESGPARLMAGAEPRAGVAVEILVERDRGRANAGRRRTCGGRR